MRIIIIEDEKLTAADLAATIIKLQPRTEVTAILSSVKESISYFQRAPQEADLVFSDIQLGDGTSFDIFSQVKITAPIIFCTAFDEYALDAFKANGIDYILKPFTDHTIKAALVKYQILKESLAGPQQMESLLSLFADRHAPSSGALLVYDRDKIVPVAFSDIALFFLRQGVASLTTFEQKTYTLNKTLDELESIGGAAFFRVNRQYLVNRRAVLNASGSSSRKLAVALSIPSDDVILISKEKVPQFLSWLTKV